MNKNYDISSVEETVKGIIRRLGVSDKVYCNRPQAVEGHSDDYVVARVSGMMVDLGPFARCTVAISLFAKDINNLKNSKKLSVMQQRLMEGFPMEENKLVFTDHPRILGDTIDDFGFHARVIQFNNVIIKSV